MKSNIEKFNYAPTGVYLLVLLCVCVYFAQIILPYSLSYRLQLGLIFSPSLYDASSITPYYYISALTRFLTYSFCHIDFYHMAINLIFLVAFGIILNRRLGSVRFLIVCMLGSACGAAAHLFWYGYDGAGLIGASAVVSVNMGAVCRFCFQDNYENSYRHLAPLLSFKKLIKDSKTRYFIIVFILLNLSVNFLPSYFGESSIISWQAHIGGFIAGLLSMSFLDTKKPH